MNRGPIVLSIEEVEYLLDQLPPPGSGDAVAEKLREKLSLLLSDLRKNAEGMGKGTR